MPACKSCGACEKPEACACCGACKNCGRVHAMPGTKEFAPGPSTGVAPFTVGQIGVTPLAVGHFGPYDGGVQLLSDPNGTVKVGGWVV